MLRYEYINKGWIVSRSARLVYRTAAAASLALIPVVVAIQLYPTHSILKNLLFLSVLGTALNQIGMEYFLLRFDDSHPLKQVIWFVVMIFAPIGPALYCFIVYSRSNALRSSLAGVHDGGSASV